MSDSAFGIEIHRNEHLATVSGLRETQNSNKAVIEGLLTRARREFHRQLVADKTLLITRVTKSKKSKGTVGEVSFDCASNSDSDQVLSVEVGTAVARTLGASHETKRLDGQKAGTQFELAVQRFLESTFPHLQGPRPGRWAIEHVGGSRAEYHLARYEPYRHLAELARAIDADPKLSTVLGNSYNIAPDVLVVRRPETDEYFNSQDVILDELSGLRSPFRASNQDRVVKRQRAGIVHAVVSCKWTLRSDRAQNARSEAINLIRNRKGRAPHIAVVTGEPSPSRIASLALGTGDVDTVYHFALDELQNAVDVHGSPEAVRILGTLVDGDRLRDIADLPIDLAV